MKTKYYRRANVIKNSTGNFKYDLNSNRMYSYDWWCFFMELGGMTVFNNFSYSNSTNKHQNEGMSQLDYKVDLVVYTDKSLDNPEWIVDAISRAEETIASLEKQLSNPRCWKSKRTERQLILGKQLIYLAKLNKIKDSQQNADE